MKNLRYARWMNTARSIFYLALLAALAWVLIRSAETREAIGVLGVSLLWIFILFAGLIVVMRWMQFQRAPLIYPFVNATGDKDNKEKYDAWAQNFSELLQVEIQRITHLLFIPESIAVNNPAYEKNQVPRPIITPAGPASLGKARVEDELGETLKGIGSLSFGPLSLPLGALLYLVIQVLQGGGITGKLQKGRSGLSVVASFANRKFDLKSESPGGSRPGEEEDLRGLARQLAYMMSSDFSDFPPNRWQSFRELIDGLEHYRRYLLSGKRNRFALESAQKHLEQAIVEDGQYAWAYYNLGLLYEELENPDSAFEMFKLAVQKEPSLREAQFRLGQAYFQRGQVLNAINAGKRAVELARQARKPFPVARSFLGQWLVNNALLFDIEENFPEAVKLCQQGLESLKAASKEYRRLLRQERRRMDFSEQRMASLKAGTIFTLKELSRAYREYAAVLERAPEDLITTRKIQSAYKQSEVALQEGLELVPESSETHAELGEFYNAQQLYPLAQKHFERAGGISPEDKSIVLGLGATYLTPAFDLLTPLVAEYRDNEVGWKENWPEQRIQALRSQLNLAEAHYGMVINLIREQGEAGIDDQTHMISALNGLSTVLGAQSFLECIQDNDASGADLLSRAKQYLGKALVLNPFVVSVYDNLASIYLIEVEMIPLPGGDDVPEQENVIDLKPDAEIDTSKSELLRDAYGMLAEFSLQYGNTAQDQLLGITLALVSSTPEQRTSLELVGRFLDENRLDLPALDQLDPSPDTQIYLWVAAWMMIERIPDLGILYLEKALEMGAFPEMDLVDYDIGTIYQQRGDWNNAVDYFNRMGSSDPYYWQGQIALADSLREMETAGLLKDSSPPQAPVTENSPEKTVETEETAMVSVPAEEPQFEPFEKADAESAYTDALWAAGSDPYRRALALAARADLRRVRKNYGAAIKDCHEALNLVPAYAYPHAILALVYLDLYEYERSIENWQQAAELVQDLDPPLYHLGLGDAYNAQADGSDDPAEAVKLRWKAVKEYRHAIRMSGPDEGEQKASALSTVGDILARLKQYAGAETSYLGALELSKDKLEEHSLHTRLGTVYVRRGLFGDARREYQQAIRLCETRIQEIEGRQEKESIDSYYVGMAHALNLLAYYLHAERGISLETGLGLVNRALEALERSGQDPAMLAENRGAYLDTRGWIYFRQGKLDLARRDLEHALEETMGTVYEHGHLAQVYARLADESQDEGERKQLMRMSKEQWDFAFKIDHDGIWADYH